jgi:hypothetical protein
VVLDQEERRSRVVRNVREDVPHFLVVGEDVDPAFGGCLGTGLGENIRTLLAFDAEADQCTDLRAELDRLFTREVAQVRDLDLAVGVLVHGQSVDHPDGVALAQPLQLLDDLAMELGMVEPEDDQLNWSYGHA